MFSFSICGLLVGFDSCMMPRWPLAYPTRRGGFGTITILGTMRLLIASDTALFHDRFRGLLELESSARRMRLWLDELADVARAGWTGALSLSNSNSLVALVRDTVAEGGDPRRQAGSGMSHTTHEWLRRQTTKNARP